MDAVLTMTYNEMVDFLVDSSYYHPVVRSVLGIHSQDDLRLGITARPLPVVSVVAATVLHLQITAAPTEQDQLPWLRAKCTNYCKRFDNYDHQMLASAIDVKGIINMYNVIGTATLSQLKVLLAHCEALNESRKDPLYSSSPGSASPWAPAQQHSRQPKHQQLPCMGVFRSGLGLCSSSHERILLPAAAMGIAVIKA